MTWQGKHDEETSSLVLSIVAAMSIQICVLVEGSNPNRYSPTATAQVFMRAWRREREDVNVQGA